MVPAALSHETDRASAPAASNTRTASRLFDLTAASRAVPCERQDALTLAPAAKSWRRISTSPFPAAAERAALAVLTLAPCANRNLTISRSEEHTSELQS